MLHRVAHADASLGNGRRDPGELSFGRSAGTLR